MKEIKYIIILIIFGIFASELLSFELPNEIVYCKKNDIFIDKKYYKVCFDKKAKGPSKVYYGLDGKVSILNIKKRPSFYGHKEFKVKNPELYITSKDYKYSSFQLGHLANDASFDYSKDVLYSIYDMINIVPQYPSVNRKTWRNTEYRERQLTLTYGKILVIINIYYDYSKRLKPDSIAIPKYFIKRIYTYPKKKLLYKDTVLNIK